MGGSSISTILAGVGGFIAGGPIGAALAVTSSLYQQQQARKARRRLENQISQLRDESLGQEIRVSGSAQGLDIHYGLIMKKLMGEYLFTLNVMLSQFLFIEDWLKK